MLNSIVGLLFANYFCRGPVAAIYTVFNSADLIERDVVLGSRTVAIHQRNCSRRTRKLVLTCSRVIDARAGKTKRNIQHVENAVAIAVLPTDQSPRRRWQTRTFHKTVAAPGQNA